MTNSLALGIDFGTSGSRAIAIDRAGGVVAEARVPTAPSCAETAIDWRAQLDQTLAQLGQAVRRRIQSIAINGTSGTVLLCDPMGHPLDLPLFYNDGRGQSVLAQIQAIAPPDHVTQSATSSLAKLLWWRSERYGGRWPDRDSPRLLHQADWLAAQLHGHWHITDYHNGLKLGADPATQTYPDWLRRLDVAPALPDIWEPGQPIGQILPTVAARWDLPIDCLVCTGTTDSIAAFLASGARRPGQAVTSLGSTLVLKLLSHVPVADRTHGIYSHYLGRSLLDRLHRAFPAANPIEPADQTEPADRWLVGGASNAGGCVLRQFFTDAEVATLSAQIDPSQPSPLDYYPLPAPGDRFPICDPDLPPRLTPQPTDRAAFLYGILDGIARIEAQGYHLLQQYGATPLQQVETAGGGARNPTWTAIRSRHLGCPVQAAQHTEAAYGTACLAWAGGATILGAGS